MHYLLSMNMRLALKRDSIGANFMSDNYPDTVKPVRHSNKLLNLIGCSALIFVMGSNMSLAEQPSAKLLGQFSDWAAYSTSAMGKKICYAMSQPKKRLPENLNRDPGYVFVSYRPSDDIFGEVTAILGFPADESKPAVGTIDDVAFDFSTKIESAWVKDTSKEGDVVAAFVKGIEFRLSVVSSRGNETTDVYSLRGFTAANNAAKQACS